MDGFLEGLKDFKTTVVGIVVLVLLFVLASKGVITFDQFWEKVIWIVGLLLGGGLLTLNTKKIE